MAELSKKQREYLTHMLGAESHISKHKWGYRNHYCASVGCTEESELDEMAALGLVVRGRTLNAGESVFFHATEAGMDAINLKPAQKKRAMTP